MNEHQSTLESSVQAGGSFGYGPFTCGGSYSHNHKKSDFSYDFQSDGLHIDGVQLVGYVSAITPASPKLDSKDYMQKAQPASTSTTTAATTTTTAAPVAATN